MLYLWHMNIHEKFPGSPSGKDSLPKESISRIFYLKDKRIPFVHQETPANCGPLAIANGLQALKNIQPKLRIPDSFAVSSAGIRKLLASDPDLKNTLHGFPNASDIAKDNYVLNTLHISNILERLASETNIEITGNRFSLAGIPSNKVTDTIKNSDMLIRNKDFHYVSFARLDEQDWVNLDSMATAPSIVSQQFLEDDFQDVGKVHTIFMGLKVTDPQIIITPKARPKIIITKKN